MITEIPASAIITDGKKSYVVCPCAAHWLVRVAAADGQEQEVQCAACLRILIVR